MQHPAKKKATVMGCLHHGAGVCDEQSAGRSLGSSREDENFLAALRHSATVKTGEFPPTALVEYHDPEQSQLGSGAFTLSC